WAFSLAFDGSTRLGMSYLDVRVRFGHDADIQNFHLLAIPLYQRHTDAYMLDVLVRFLDATIISWRDYVLAVSSDGAS
ncbi:hypothetical protein L914_05392, partial [Phytophthora nicotianae]